MEIVLLLLDYSVLFTFCCSYVLVSMSLNNASTVTVENAIRKSVPKSICSTDDVKEAVKSYAEVTKENQRKVIAEATLAKSSKNVVESVVRQVDADKIERERRKINVVVLNVPEPPKTASIGQKKKLLTGNSWHGKWGL